MSQHPERLRTAIPLRSLATIRQDGRFQVIIVGRDYILEPHANWTPEAIMRAENDLEVQHRFQFRFVIRLSLEHSYAIGEDFAAQGAVVSRL